MEAEGQLVVFTDGSSAMHDDIGLVAGFGAYFGSPLDFSDFVPIREQQSNDRAELRALLKCLQLVLRMITCVGPLPLTLNMWWMGLPEELYDGGTLTGPPSLANWPAMWTYGCRSSPC